MIISTRYVEEMDVPVDIKNEDGTPMTAEQLLKLKEAEDERWLEIMDSVYNYVLSNRSPYSDGIEFIGVRNED